MPIVRLRTVLAARRVEIHFRTGRPLLDRILSEATGRRRAHWSEAAAEEQAAGPLRPVLATWDAAEEIESEAGRFPTRHPHRIAALSAAAGCAEAMPDAHLEVVEDSGHLVVLDQKDRLTELIRSWC